MIIKKISICIILLCIQLVCFARGTGKTTIRGTQCEYDTITYRPIAPGATLLQLQFNNIPISGTKYKMRTHIIKIDQTNPYNSFYPYLSNDSYFSVAKQSDDITRVKNQGLKPVASIDGGAFVMTNHTTSTEKANEILGSLVSNGEVKFEAYGSNVNCYTDGEKVVRIGKTSLNGSVTIHGNSFTIGQINHCRDIADGNELITLFCNGIGVSRAVDTNSGTEVKVKLLDESKVVTSKDIRCKVLDVLDKSNNSFSDGEAILSGVGSAATFLKTLNANDIVTLKLSYVDDSNNTIDVQNQVTNLLGYYVKDGEVLPNSQKNTAIVAIGNTQDGKTVYWADMEISANSNAPAICLADLLKNMGVYNAMSLDGGPSAEMTVDGKYITVNQIPNLEGRYIPSGYILYSTAPDDNTLTDLILADSSAKTMCKGDNVALRIYGYNQYGEMISSEAQNSSSVQITCTNGLGTISNGVFTASKTGTGYINIKLDGSSKVLSIPVTIVEKRTLTAYPHNIFTGENRACQVKLSYTDDNGTINVNPLDATWSKTGKYVVLSCSGGYITPWESGSDNVYVKFKDVCDTITVTVENLENAVASLDISSELYDKTHIQTHLPSVPESFTANLTGDPNSAISLSYSLGNGTTLTKSTTVGDDGTISLTIPLDYYAADTYPVTVLEVTGTSAYMTALYANYKTTAEINAITCDNNSKTDNSVYNLAGQRVNTKYTKGIFIRKGKKIVVK